MSELYNSKREFEKEWKKFIGKRNKQHKTFFSKLFKYTFIGLDKIIAHNFFNIGINNVSKYFLRDRKGIKNE